MDTLKRIKAFKSYLSDARHLRGLLDSNVEALGKLSWYDLPLADAMGWRGAAKVFYNAVLPKNSDEIAANYGMTSLYYAPPASDGMREAAPAVWPYQGISTKPWFDGPSIVRQTLEGASEVIIEEFSRLAEYVSTHPDNATLTDKGEWQGLFLYGTAGKNQKLCGMCPGTMSALEKLPVCKNFGFVLFSKLKPGTHILAHTGSSNLRLRYHLGINVPEPEKAYIRVGTESRHWQTGKCIAFDDSYSHEVHHEGERDRVVLVVDVWNPKLSSEAIRLLEDGVFTRFGRIK